MKSIYPNYKGKRVYEIKKKLTAEDNGILEDFLDYCRITAGEKKVGNIERILLQIYDVMGNYSFDLDRLRKFLSILNQSDKLASTQNDIKKVLKRFLKWHYKDWNERFVEFRDIIIKDGRNHAKINSSTILSKQSIEKLIRKAENFRYKAMIMLMFESAGRPEEILKLKWCDIDLEKGSVKLDSSKTGRVRVNPIKEAIIHLKRYKQEFPYTLVRDDDYVFPSGKTRTSPISIQAVQDYYKKLGVLAINKHIFPYLIRHTRLTPLHQKLSPKAYEKFADHSIETAIKYYSHLSNDDVRTEMFEKVYHVEEISEEEKDIFKKLKEEMNEMKTENSSQKESLKEYSAENKKIWKWLEKLTLMNKAMLKAATRDGKIETELKMQFKEMFSEGEEISLMV